MEVDEAGAEGGGSDRQDECVSYIDVHILKSDPLGASSYIDLPKRVKMKRAIINIKNKDRKCFLWSVLAYLHPVKEHLDSRKSK